MRKKIAGSILTVCMLAGTAGTVFAASRRGVSVYQVPSETAIEAAGVTVQGNVSTPDTSASDTAFADIPTSDIPTSDISTSDTTTSDIPMPDIQPPDTPEQNPSDQESEKKEGWVKAKGKTYFFKNGKKQTGWQKIEEKYYYFDKKGVRQKNKIVGDKKSGYYYVDPAGIRVKDTAIQAAVAFVMKHSNPKDSARKRLMSCYDGLAEYHYHRTGREKPGAEKMKSYALEMFKNKKGDCYRFAAALAYVARVLGYESRTAFDQTVTLHGWTEIKVKGKWQTCDCSMRRVDKKNNFFLVDKKTYASLVKIKWGSDVQWDSTYRMYAKKGNISWKRV